MFRVEVGEPQDCILSQPTEVAQSASVSLCTWVSALLQAVMKTREAFSLTHELPDMEWGLLVLERRKDAHSRCGMCLPRASLDVLMGLTYMDFA